MIGELAAGGESGCGEVFADLFDLCLGCELCCKFRWKTDVLDVSESKSTDVQS